jgi:hypothetical protein
MTEWTIRDSQFESKPSRILTCDSCNKRIEHRAGRRPRFCSDRCRYRENGRGRVRKAVWVPDTGAPTKLRKNSNKFKALQRAKTLSSHRILAPANVLAIEVFNRSWQPTISSDGVVVEIGRLHVRALVS